MVAAIIFMWAMQSTDMLSEEPNIFHRGLKEAIPNGSNWVPKGFLPSSKGIVPWQEHSALQELLPLYIKILTLQISLFPYLDF
jgi:hypothetical protein